MRIVAFFILSSLLSGFTSCQSGQKSNNTKKAAFVLIFLATIITGCKEETKKRTNRNKDTTENTVSEARRQEYSITSFDYSNLWLIMINELPESESENENIVYQGIIGDNYRRIQIKFLEIEPSGQTPGLYNVTGKSKVNNNICGFEGYFQVGEVKTYDGAPDSPDVYNGSVHGRYELWENKEEKDSGFFNGEFLTLFDVIEKDDDTMITMNQGHYTFEGINEFIGTWTSYQTGKSKICNWGWHIPPNTPNLFRHRENEVYDFNNKYLNQGWESYVYGRGLFIVTNFDLGEDVKYDAETLAIKRDKYLNIEDQEWWQK